MVPQIPYAAIGFGIVVVLGIWAFIVAETVKARGLIAGIPILLVVFRAAFPTPTGRLIFLVSAMIYGVGIVIFLRLAGVRVR